MPVVIGSLEILYFCMRQAVVRFLLFHFLDVVYMEMRSIRSSVIMSRKSYQQESISLPNVVIQDSIHVKVSLLYKEVISISLPC